MNPILLHRPYNSKQANNIAASQSPPGKSDVNLRYEIKTLLELHYAL
jgi:hypothetical protein